MKNLKSLLLASLILAPGLSNACHVSCGLSKAAGVGAIAVSVYSALYAVDAYNTNNGINIDEGSLIYKLNNYIQNSSYFNGSVGKAIKKYLLTDILATTSITTFVLGKKALLK